MKRFKMEKVNERKTVRKKIEAGKTSRNGGVGRRICLAGGHRGRQEMGR